MKLAFSGEGIKIGFWVVEQGKPVAEPSASTAKLVEACDAGSGTRINAAGMEI